MSLAPSLDHFVSQYVNASNQNNRGLIIQYDSDFDSPCYHGNSHIDGDWIEWKPKIRYPQGSMKNLENALDLVINEDIEVLFGRYFSLDLNAKTSRGELTLLQALNEGDYARLQKNLIAHVLMKRRLKQSETLFFALTDVDDLLLSVLPLTGEVVLEWVGREHHETVADSLSTFFTTLTPNPRQVEL